MAPPVFRRRFQGRGRDEVVQMRDVQALEDAVADVFAYLLALPTWESRLLTGVSVSTSASALPHGLGRPVRGLVLASRTANVQVWRSPWTTPTGGVDLVAEATSARIVASASATVDLLVF